MDQGVRDDFIGQSAQDSADRLLQSHEINPMKQELMPFSTETTLLLHEDELAPVAPEPSFPSETLIMVDAPALPVWAREGRRSSPSTPALTASVPELDEIN